MSASNQQPLINQPITISWNSNTAPCTSASGTGYDGWGGKSLQTAGTVTLTEPSAGSYFYQLRCGVPPLFADASVTVNFIAAAPPQLQASASSVLAGQHVRLSWSSSDGSTCNAGGGAAGDGWAGSLAASGSVDVRETGVATYTYLLTCGAAPQVSTQVVFTSPPPAPQQTLPPTVSLTASASSITAGQSVTLTYTAANADSCTGTGGGAGDNWPSSTLNVSGATRTVTEATPGSYTYTITCTRTGFAAVTSSVTVAVNAQVIVSASPSEPKSSGGGGVIRVMDSLCLALLTLVRLTYGSRRRRRRGVTGACGNSRCRLSA